MAATIIGAIDQQTANARGPHFGEGDFLRRACPMIAPISARRKPLRVGASGGHAPISGIAGRGSQRPAQEAQTETICGLCVTPVQHSQHLVASEMSGRTYSTPPPLELPLVVADIRLSFNFTYLYTQR